MFSTGCWVSHWMRCKLESAFWATGLVQQSSRKRGHKVVAACGSKVVPELRFSLCAKRRVVEKRSATEAILVREDVMWTSLFHKLAI